MPLIGLNFDKLFVEKKKKIEAPLKINSSMAVISVEKEDMQQPKGMEALRFNFEFKLDYQPKQAEMTLAGHVLYSEKEKEAEAMLAEWKKTKKFNPLVVQQVLNAALLRANIKALLLSQEVGLPPHINLPGIAQKQKSGSYIG